MRSHISPGYVFGAVLDSVLSLRWIPFCSIGWHKTHFIREAFTSRLLCVRCGKSEVVGR